jgi:hypothetical protein
MATGVFFLAGLQTGKCLAEVGCEYIRRIKSLIKMLYRFFLFVGSRKSWEAEKPIGAKRPLTTPVCDANPLFKPLILAPAPAVPLPL